MLVYARLSMSSSSSASLGSFLRDAMVDLGRWNGSQRICLLPNSVFLYLAYCWFIPRHDNSIWHQLIHSIWVFKATLFQKIWRVCLPVSSAMLSKVIPL